MAHRRSFRGRVSESQRRKKLWGPFVAFPRASNGSGTQQTFMSPSIQLSYAGGTGSKIFSDSSGSVFQAGVSGIDPESTLLRIRGSLQLPKNEFEAEAVDAGTTTIAFGIGVLESGAALLGAFPNPATTEGSDWDGWMFYRSQNSGTVDSAGSIVDVKAMRKIQSGYSLVFVFGGSKVAYTDGDNATLDPSSAQFTSRGLFLLP